MAKRAIKIADLRHNDKRRNIPTAELESFVQDEDKRPKPLRYPRKWITSRLRDGVEPHEIGVFVRSPRELRRTRAAVKKAGAAAVELSDTVEVTAGRLSAGTMRMAKGLEFRAVAVMACDDEIIPSQERIENVGDEADLEEVYDSACHLLYVACTRARDYLLVTGGKSGVRVPG